MIISKPLIRSRDNRMVAGVLGGLAEYFNWDPTWMRVLFVLISVIFAVVPSILIYFLLWIVVPNVAPKSHQLSHSEQTWLDKTLS